jgi:putative colanic acid biosynthesis acetyltransferase WcaF
LAILNAKEFKSLQGGPSFTLNHRLYRAVWSLAWFLLAAWTPAPFHAWRRLTLIAFGARIAPGARIYPSARVWDPSKLVMNAYSCLGPRVDCYSMAKIFLGTYAIVSQDAVLCAGSHDVDDAEFQLVAKPIVIADRAWVAAGAFVGPGVAIGEGAVLGARAVTFKNLSPWGIYVGNPASFLRRRNLGEAAPKESP